jgi:hypothetical protein
MRKYRVRVQESYTVLYTSPITIPSTRVTAPDIIALPETRSPP